MNALEAFFGSDGVALTWLVIHRMTKSVHTSPGPENGMHGVAKSFDDAAYHRSAGL